MRTTLLVLILTPVLCLADAGVLDYLEPVLETPVVATNVAYVADVLEERSFDAFVEELCRPFYIEGRGRPSIPPGVYFRMLMVGYFEGLDSEREIAWRCRDSLSLRRILGVSLTERTPDHSSLCRIRQKLDLETHREVFAWVLATLVEWYPA